MSDLRTDVPHFLRVVRALAGVRGPVPVMAALTTVVAGVHCGSSNSGGAPVQCATDAGCPASEACGVDGLCYPLTTTSCKAGGGECDRGSFCDIPVGKCSSGGGCTTDADCASGMVCTDDGTCVGGCFGICGMACMTDADCPSGQVCDPTCGLCIP